MADEGVARFYTRSRRFPKMIGRMTDGSRIPGGPYTLTQVGFGGAVLLVLLMTRTMWSTGSVILDLAITLGAAWGATWIVGLIPMTRRNLLLAFMDAIAAMTTSERNSSDMSDLLGGQDDAELGGVVARRADPRAEDRLLVAGHYIIPLYDAGGQWVARWSHIGVPDKQPLPGFEATTLWRKP